MNHLEFAPPAPLKADAGPFHKLQHMAKMQQYRLYLIQKAQKNLEELAKELGQESAFAAHLVLNLTAEFRSIEMIYLQESRHHISIQSEKVTDKDIMKEGNLD